MGKAYGEAFCNRTEETKALIGNIENGKHTFLVAPRRYGKSSLCERAFEKINMPWAIIDFHLSLREKDAERAILKGVTTLINESVGSVEKIMRFIKLQAKRLQPKFTVAYDDFKVEFAVATDNSSSPAENVVEALLILEKILRQKKKRAALLMDEFQEISKMDNGRSLEGAIRHAAQEMQHLSIVFSGSNPHLLKAMFEDERRPLYKLCRKLHLNRIEASHYQAHLNKISKKIWNMSIDPLLFDKIISLTERHPYYINYLCDTLFSDNEKAPKAVDADKAWIKVIEEEKSDLLKDFFSLTHNQRAIMRHIATHGGASLFSSASSKTMDISVNSISRAIESLLEQDYIEKNEDQYRLIIPAYKNLLVE